MGASGLEINNILLGWPDVLSPFLSCFYSSLGVFGVPIAISWQTDLDLEGRSTASIYEDLGWGPQSSLNRVWPVLELLAMSKANSAIERYLAQPMLLEVDEGSLVCFHGAIIPPCMTIRKDETQ